MTATSTPGGLDDARAVVARTEEVENAYAAYALVVGSGPTRVRSSSIRRRRPRPASLARDQRVGAWRVEGQLGRGGMASVYAVTHRGFGKRAALKLCHRTVLGPEFTAKTFLREARIVHKVEHAGMPDVFATGVYDGRPYLVMERLAGETLGHLMERNAIDRAAALAVLVEVCDVLAAAHAAGVVHCDLKLENVFVQHAPGVGGQRIKLLDWGVSRVVGERDPMRGMIAGTLTYVAPEQLRTDELTPAADLYSLGVLAYHVLLGAPPFCAGSDVELMRKHLDEPPPSPRAKWPKIPDRLARVLLAMLAKHPADRPTIDTIRCALLAARDALTPRRTFVDWLTGAPPVDVFGRSAALGKARARVVGAAVGVALMLASLASLISV